MAKRDKRKFDDPQQLNRLVENTQLTGDLMVDSNLRIDGNVVGNIVCKGKFVLGNNGTVEGNIFAEEVELSGKVKGEIKCAGLLKLCVSSIVKGDVLTGRIVIEDGAKIDGSIQMGKFSLSDVQQKIATGKKLQLEGVDA